MGFTRIVLRRMEGQMPDLQKENLQKVVISSEHLLNLINGLLDLAKIDARQNGGERGYLQSRGYYQYDDDHRRAAAQRRARADRQRHHPQSPAAKTDRDKLKQILFNLLSNAAKFTEQGEIKVSASPENGNLKLAGSQTPASA